MDLLYYKFTYLTVGYFVLTEIANNATATHKGPTSPFVNVKFTGYFLDGGTGRFEKAHGTFEYNGIYNKVINEGSATLTGKIMYHK